MNTRTNQYFDVTPELRDRDSAIVEQFKTAFEALLEAHKIATDGLEVKDENLGDFEGLLRDAWSDTWALVENDINEASGR